MKNRKNVTKTIERVIVDYADEQKAALQEQKESIALACILRCIYIYRKAGASAMDVNVMIGFAMESFGIEVFSDLDAKIIADALVYKFN